MDIFTLFNFLFIHQGNFARCDNNCAGVDPNAIIGGGVAAAGIIGISAQTIAGPAAGLGLGGFAGSYFLIFGRIILMAIDASISNFWT